MKGADSKPRFPPGLLASMKPKSTWITRPWASSKIFPLCLRRRCRPLPWVRGCVWRLRKDGCTKRRGRRGSERIGARESAGTQVR